MAAYEYCFDIGGLDSEPWRSVSISCRIGITVTMEMLKILIHLKFDGHRYRITAKEGGLAVGYGTVPFEGVLSSIPPLPSPSLPPNAMVTRSAAWQWRPCLIGTLASYSGQGAMPWLCASLFLAWVLESG
jgi:hypothetical protein